MGDDGDGDVVMDMDVEGTNATPPSPPLCSFNALPAHITATVLFHLDFPEDVVHASHVCRLWRAILCDNGASAANFYARRLSAVEDSTSAHNSASTADDASSSASDSANGASLRRLYLAKALALGWRRAIPNTSKLVFSVRHGAGFGAFALLPDGLGGCRHMLHAPYAVLPHRGGCSDAAAAARPPKVRLHLADADADGLGCADVRSRRLRAVQFEEGAPGPPKPSIRADDALRRCAVVVLDNVTAQLSATGDTAAVWIDARRAATLRMAHPATAPVCLLGSGESPCLLAGGRHGFEMWRLSRPIPRIPNADARLVVRRLVPPPPVPLFGFAPASVVVWSTTTTTNTTASLDEDEENAHVHVAAMANDGQCAILRNHKLTAATMASTDTAAPPSENWIALPLPSALTGMGSEDIVAAGTLRLLRGAGGFVGQGTGLVTTVHRLTDASSSPRTGGGDGGDAESSTAMHQSPAPASPPRSESRAVRDGVVSHLVAYALDPEPRLAWHTEVRCHGALLALDAAPPWIAAIAADGALLLFRARDGSLARRLPHPEVDGAPAPTPSGVRLPPGALLRPAGLNGSTGSVAGGPSSDKQPTITDASVQFGPFAEKDVDVVGSRDLYVLVERVAGSHDLGIGRTGGMAMASPARALSITRHSVDDTAAASEHPPPPPTCLCGDTSVLRWRHMENGSRRSFYCCAGKRRATVGKCNFIQYYE